MSEQDQLGPVFEGLNRAIERVVDEMWQRFRVPARVELDEGRALVWKKLHGQFGLFIERTRNGEPTTWAPLLCTNAKDRIDAANAIPELLREAAVAQNSIGLRAQAATDLLNEVVLALEAES